MNLYSRVVSILLVMAAFLVCTSNAFALEANGEGVDRHQALNNALRSAVEMEVGTAVASGTLVENGVLLQDEIATRSKGYVSSYKVLSEGKLEDGGYQIKVDATVDRKLLFDNYQTLDILQRMSGLPRLLIFAVNDGFNSIPASSMDKTVHEVSEVFGTKFRFEVLDWPVARTKYSNIEGMMSRAKAIKYNNLIKADYIVTAELDNTPGKTCELILSCVRISDNLKIGEIRREVKGIPTGLKKPAEIFEAAVASAHDDVYWASVKLAKKMLDFMESELDRGKGFRYTLTFLGFPEVSEIGPSLEEIPGFVRREVKRKSDSNVEIVYWSTLSTEALDKSIDKDLKALGVEKFDSKVSGRVLKYRWRDPEGF